MPPKAQNGSHWAPQKPQKKSFFFHIQKELFTWKDLIHSIWCSNEKVMES